MTTITGGPGDDNLQGIGAGPYDIFGLDGNDILRGGSYYDGDGIRRGHAF